MKGLMQDATAHAGHLFERCERYFPTKGIITATASGLEHETYGEWAERTRRLGGVLDDLGISADGRVATFGWNTARHLELYFAAPCTGRVLHTLNIRLFPEQLTYIVNHAEDEVIFVDRSLVGLLWPLLPTFTTVKHLVVMDDGKGDVPDPDGARRARLRGRCWPTADPVDFHVDDENQAASMCYTSGTTGNPKGVVYSHRSTLPAHDRGDDGRQHRGPRGATASCRSCRCSTPTPGAWPTPRVASGADLVMPGPDLSPPAIANLIEDEKVTVAAGVPTIWMGVLPELKGRDTSALRAIPCGGSAVPKALSEAYREQLGLPILQAWGMTETSPVASIGWTQVARCADRARERAGRPAPAAGPGPPGVEFRIVEPGGDRAAAVGRRDVGRAPVPRARGSPRATTTTTARPSRFTADGWLRTGDVATIDAEGYIRLVDRTKDVIKSGGEWISSVELENEIMGHPKVAEAAVIGVPSHRSGPSGRWPAWWSSRGRRSPRRRCSSSSTAEGGQVVAARRRRVHRRGAQDVGRQVLQEDPPRALRRPASCRSPADSCTAAAHYRSEKRVSTVRAG